MKKITLLLASFLFVLAGYSKNDMKIGTSTSQSNLKSVATATWHTFTPSYSAVGLGGTPPPPWYSTTFNSIYLPNDGDVIQTYVMTGGTQYRVSYSASLIHHTPIAAGLLFVKVNGINLYYSATNYTWSSGNLTFEVSGSPGLEGILNDLVFQRYY